MLILLTTYSSFYFYFSISFTSFSSFFILFINSCFFIANVPSSIYNFIFCIYISCFNALIFIFKSEVSFDYYDCNTVWYNPTSSIIVGSVIPYWFSFCFIMRTYYVVLSVSHFLYFSNFSFNFVYFSSKSVYLFFKTITHSSQ